MAWLSLPEAERGERPKWQDDSDDAVHCLEIRPGPEVWRHETHGSYRIESRFVTCGGGANFALAAMHCGKDAAAAVQIACELSDGTGGGVDVLALQLGDRPEQST